MKTPRRPGLSEQILSNPSLRTNPWTRELYRSSLRLMRKRRREGQ